MVCRGVLGHSGLRKDQVSPKNFSTHVLNFYFLKVDNYSINTMTEKNNVNVSISSILLTWYKSQ